MTENSSAFKSVRHGYDPAEVDQHVAQLAQVASDAAERAADLEEALAKARSEAAEATAAAQRSAVRARSRALAATPPPSSRDVIPCSRHASTALVVMTSATASWKEAATSATGRLSRSSNRRASVMRRRVTVLRGVSPKRRA